MLLEPIKPAEALRRGERLWIARSVSAANVD
jgi:hypothetical protein